MTTDFLLDVDGVLNAIARSTPAWGWESSATRYRHIFRGEGGGDTWASVNVNRAFWITYAQDLIDSINRMESREDVRFFWLTTWLEEATSLARKIGLTNGHTWTVLGSDEYHAHRVSYDRGWWKLDAAKKHASENPENRIVWIDDDLYDSDAREWLATQGDRFLAVQPDSNLGVTRDLFDAIERWVNRTGI